MLKKWVLLVVFGVILLGLTVACTATDDSELENDASNQAGEDENGANHEGNNDSADEKVLRINNGNEPTSFNPPKGFDSVSYSPLNNLLEGLTRLGEDHTPQPAMAEKWDISEDGTTYTFTIRSDANWSNGDPVTADDFVYAWTALLDPEKGFPSAFLGYFIKGGEAFNSGEGSADDLGLQALDDKTFEVTLEAPAGFFLNLVTNPAFFPVNHQVAKENPDWHAEADTFVANGPFKLQSWEHDNEFVMVKNDRYWDKAAVNLDEIRWYMVNETTTEYQMFDNGELDMASIPSEMSDQLINNDNVQIEDQGGLEFFRFNLQKEPFQNKKIRKAFAFAVDKQQIAEYVVKNKAKPAFGFVSPGFQSPEGTDFREANGDLVPFAPDEAKKLLEEGMAEEGYDELPEVVLSYNTSETHKSVAEAIQSMYNEHLGLDVTLENKEWQVFSEEQKALELQLSRSSFLFDYADPVNFLESFITDSSMNRTGYSNAEYNDLIEQAKTEPEEEKRWAHMYEAEKMLAENMPIFPIRYYNQVSIQNPDLTGVLRHPVGYLELKHADIKQ
ncbi:peptide ABC transporter substrate-binding protein [Lentibacillus saliphilus]|uniref:peptide ABC transporter substrate-binding protein n=1 Tax=Lentibacillus saliphilus TaxID=2737028 RepID=UPI001C2FBFDF|nr:peptide ABC transporter substrate-binding protein [Lentibacillus saliphilus]